MMQRLHKEGVRLLFSVILISLCNQVIAQRHTGKPSPWEAQWITGSGPQLNRSMIDGGETLKDFGVYKFRKTFSLDSIPASFEVKVSADNRYKLFVNGEMVSLGPARGDLYFWNYETVDIAGSLHRGKNIISALVWNFGSLRPEAQITYRTGFILQGPPGNIAIHSNDTWKVIRDSGYHIFPNQVPGYYVAGPGELVNMNHIESRWLQEDFNDSTWPSARRLAAGHTKESIFDSPAWMLVPSAVPPMEMKIQRLMKCRKADGVSVPAGFPQHKNSFTIPANTDATLLLDQEELTNAYPTLVFSGGKNAAISIRYAEALYIPDTTSWDTSRGPPPRFRIRGKGNRNEVDKKIFIGTADSILSNGKPFQEFTSLWWRTYRYVELKIHTGVEPLVIDDFYGFFTGYPFELKSIFESDDPQLEKILSTGWHTARLCAAETYMDCPYYEQLQYIGDTRIQALVSLYNSGDDRLVRNALSLMDHSRIAEGITLSRWPSAMPQQIPTFSLWYIGMLYDYMRYGPDTAFVKNKLPGTRQILSWFQKYQGKDGSLKNLPYWNFTDWRNDSGWFYGMSPTGKNGESAVLDLQLMWTYELAAEMESKMGVKQLGALYRKEAAQLKKTIQRKYWDSGRHLYADTEEKNLYSQHANTLAILSGMISGAAAKETGIKMLKDTAMAQASIYFKYYLHQALVKAGFGNDYLKWLDIWKENIAMGLTTWAEISEISFARSDCHAWGASPNIEFFRTVLGIDSDAPGFQKVKIEPHLGDLKHASGEIPHPTGPISVNYKMNGKGWDVSIVLPKKINGTFIWTGKRYLLKGGENAFHFK